MPKRPSLPRPVAVKDVLQGLFGPADKEGLEVRQRIRQAWEAAAPAAIREHARLVDWRRGELWVAVPDGVWGQELQFLKPKILEEMVRVLPGQVRDLRIRVEEF